MSQADRTGTGSWLPLALLTGAGTLALATGLMLAGKQKPQPVALPEEASGPIEWLGGPSRQNIDGLAYMFASENETASLLVWALQALAANNFARQLARSQKEIKSIADMLQSGVEKTIVKLADGREKKVRKRLYHLGWGRQYDKETKITRWAGTSAGRSPLKVRWIFFEMAERLLLNRIQFAELRGKRGETMPPIREWSRINSFLQYENFGETVIRQAGEDAETDPNVVVANWGKPRLVAAVEGLHFYATGV